MHRFAICFSLVFSLPTFAGTVPPDYDWQWSTIGDPGNRHTNDDEVFLWTGTRRGSVDYEYRMATTEVTVGQWLEFVEAYTPYYFQNTGNSFARIDFTGSWIDVQNGQASIDIEASANQPTNMSWEYAARYVNWLHNGKVIEDWAFESGVYDTSTFTRNPDGTHNHQMAHDPDADFWIPTVDEWTKAAYWDPNKNNGEGGYWKFQNSSDIEPLLRLERNATDGFTDGYPLDVGSFPDVQSPWGILDMAGGMSEWSESADTDNRIRAIFGTFYASDYGNLFTIDQVGWNSSAGPGVLAGMGLRLVSRVPSPGTVLPVAAAVLLLIPRRRTH